MTPPTPAPKRARVRAPCLPRGRFWEVEVLSASDSEVEPTQVQHPPPPQELLDGDASDETVIQLARSDDPDRMARLEARLTQPAPRTVRPTRRVLSRTCSCQPNSPFQCAFCVRRDAGPPIINASFNQPTLNSNLDRSMRIVVGPDQNIDINIHGQFNGATTTFVEILFQLTLDYAVQHPLTTEITVYSTQIHLPDPYISRDVNFSQVSLSLMRKMVWFELFRIRELFVFVVDLASTFPSRLLLSEPHFDVGDFLLNDLGPAPYADDLFNMTGGGLEFE